MNPPIIQGKTAIDALVLDKHAPILDDRDENGRGDGKHANKEKENIASHQNQLPAHVQRSVAEDIGSIDVEEAWSEKGDQHRGNEQLSVAFQHQQSNSEEVGVGLSAWSFEDIRVKAG